jgi:hypothetical protein
MGRRWTLGDAAAMSNSSVSLRIVRDSVDVVESTIPDVMTIAQWRSSRPRRRRRGLIRTGSAGVVVPIRPVSCDHICETTSRYDHARKVLTFLLMCPVCGTEQVVESLDYEPRPEPTVLRAA